MKRWLAIITFIACAATTLAQQNEQVVSGTGDLSYGMHVDVAGNPTWNRLIGIRTYDQDFCHYFLESEILIGPGDAAWGLSFTCLPERIGVYGSLLGGIYDNWLSCGLVWRASQPDNRFDWHFYGGDVWGPSIGLEAGVRISATGQNNGGAFSWWSGSLGVIAMEHQAYFTIGISIGVLGLSSFSLVI